MVAYEWLVHLARTFRTTYLPAALSLVSTTIASSGADVTVTKAWVPPTQNIGRDVVLSMMVRNDGAEVDAIVRATCPFANFSEKHTIDHGEGAPAKRAIPNIPVPPHSTLAMTETGYHVTLLQTREKLTEGDKFTCSVTFRKAGRLEVDVRISPSAPLF